MIVKEGDSINPLKNELEALLKEEYSEHVKKLISRELYALREGYKGEKDSQYYINREFKDCSDWTVIHDLRVVIDGEATQIDHLLINRLLQVFVLETKQFSHILSINEKGEFSLKNRSGKRRGIPSPLEQCRRHAKALERIVNKHDLAPERKILQPPITFHQIVLIAPKTIVQRPQKDSFDTDALIHSDTIHRAIEERVATGFNALRPYSEEDLFTFSSALAALHEPLRVDYRKRFNQLRESIKSSTCTSEKPSQEQKTTRQYKPKKSKNPKKSTSIVRQSSNAKAITKNNRTPTVIKGKETPRGEQLPKALQSGKKCNRCGMDVTKKQAQFCSAPHNRSKFHGQVYCFECQKVVAESKTPIQNSSK